MKTCKRSVSRTLETDDVPSSLVDLWTQHPRPHPQSPAHGHFVTAGVVRTHPSCVPSVAVKDPFFFTGRDSEDPSPR